MKRSRIILPPATESDWRWREYKAYTAVCGDCIEYQIVGSKAISLTTASHPRPRGDATAGNVRDNQVQECAA